MKTKTLKEKGEEIMDQNNSTPIESKIKETAAHVEHAAQNAAHMVKENWVLAAALATGIGTLWVSRKIKRQSMLSALASAVATTTSVLAFANKMNLSPAPALESQTSK